MSQEIPEQFTSNNISKYWNMLNFSNDITQKQIANTYFSDLKKNCPNYIDISIELYNKSNIIQDRFISSLLIYQYIKENYNKLIENKILYNNLKEFLINKILFSFIKESEQNIFESSEGNLIIERICYSISIIIIVGCLSYWPEAVDEMLSFGKQTIKHTYLATIIFGNCYEELNNIIIKKSEENQIKEKFMKNKEEFKSFINTILTNSNNVKLYNKTIILAKNLIIFEVNTLQIPNMIKVIFDNINKSNIDSISKLITRCISYSKCKKLEDDFGGFDLSEYDKKMNKDELLSLTLIIEYISLYVNNNNNYDNDVLFGLGIILCEIIENYVYLLFKKDIISQKLLKLFFFFISNKSRIISQLFFESLLVIKNFINACYRFNNYSKDEKIEFSNYLLKICENLIKNCTYKKIEKQEILLNQNNICISHEYDNESTKNIKEKNNNHINDEEDINEIDEIPINEYRNNAEDAFFNIFLIFANNFLTEGVNFFFESITKEIIPLLKLKIEEINSGNILLIESVIFAVKSIVNCFETLMTDKTPLIQFTLFLMKSNIINNDYIFSNFLLLIEEASTYFDYDKKIYSEIIYFLLNQIELRMNVKNQERLIQLDTAVLLSVCESSDDIYIDDLWQKMYCLYNKYYNQFSEISLYNLTESICSSLILQQEEKDNMKDNNSFDNSDVEGEIDNKYIKNGNMNEELSNNQLIINFTKIVELPLIRIKEIFEIINNKSISNVFGNKEKEELLKKEIIKNFNVITRILKQTTFIDDKFIINEIFNIIYSNSFEHIKMIIKEFNNNTELMKSILKMFIKSSFYLNIETINKIFNQFNELMINIFITNNENYSGMYVLKNIYSIKLKYMSDKNLDNKFYIDILDNFIKLNKQICSSILSNITNQFELIHCLSSLFSNIFPELTVLRKEDYVILMDTLYIFMEGIKTICENNIIKSILSCFTCLINSKKNELVINKYSEIIKCAFYAIDHYNNMVINDFNIFCFSCIKYDKSLFLIVLKDILNTKEFSCFNNKYKNVIINYFDYYFDNCSKLKNIVIDMMNVAKNINAQEILEEYNIELRNIKKDYVNIKNLKNIPVYNQSLN